MDRHEAILANDLGKALIRQGRLDEAAVSFERAVRLDPNLAEAHNNLAAADNDRQRYDEAIAGYRRAILLNPQYAEAHFNLGNALRGKGELQLAFAAYQTALALRPSLAEAHNGMGNVLLDTHRDAEAMSAFSKFIALRPDDAMGYNNLAVVLRKMGEPEAALQALDKAIALQPGYAKAHSNRGKILGDQRRYDAAVLALKRAVELRPVSGECLTNLVALLREIGRVHEAVAICNQIVHAFPNLAAAHGELAGLHQELGQTDEARTACIRAIELKPAFAEAHNTLGNILRDQGQLEGAIASYRRALEIRPDSIGIRSNLVFTQQFASGYDSTAILQEARHWADLHESPLLPEIRPHPNVRTKDRKLKIGYVSACFRHHSAAFFLLPVLAHHDTSAMQVFCYSGVRVPDAVTGRFMNLNHTWREAAGLSDAELARQIRADGIDILVDVTLHMQDSRLLTFARKPAPVQVTWLGYPGTTGLTTIDYRLTDPHLDPADQNDALYTERSIRLPETFWCYAPLEQTPDVSPLPALAAGHITFGCFNNFQKVTRATLELWARVLGTIPNARLIILSQPGTHREAVRAVFAQSGIAAHRIQFVGRQPLDDYFRLYQQVDLCLDTTPCPGHTTTLDSAWMGVPVITLAGRTVVGRGGVSILSNLNLRHLIARTPDDYVTIAKAVTDDLAALSELRRTLRDRLRASPLMNAGRFVTGLEAAYTRMWRTYCDRQNDAV